MGISRQIHGYLISRFYHSREICENLMHVKNPCFAAIEKNVKEITQNNNRTPDLESPHFSSVYDFPKTSQLIIIIMSLSWCGQQDQLLILQRNTTR